MTARSPWQEMSMTCALIMKEMGLREFRIRDLDQATRSFSTKIGEGAFGTVYRGVLDNGEVVAVKRLSRRCEDLSYFTSVITACDLRHPNLVQVIGWCHEEDDDFLVVYDCLPSGDLSYHLYTTQNMLPWKRRFNIAVGLASALRYTHELYAKCIVHGDVKPSNVMLDADFNARLVNFGLRLRPDHDATSTEHNMAGILGYFAPEVMEMEGKIGKECDIYSFGVVALELACSRKAIKYSVEHDKTPLVEWVRHLYDHGLILEAADTRLTRFEQEEMERLVVVGLWCVQTDPSCLRRPSMGQVISVLKGEAPLPTLPAYQVPALPGETHGTEEHEVGAPVPEERMAVSPSHNLPALESLAGMIGIEEGSEVDTLLPGFPAYQVPTKMDGIAENKTAINVEIEQHKAPKGFPYSDLEQATNNFSEASRVGEGGFGAVYKGLLNGEQVAIKRVWGGSKHGKKQYIAEIKAISDLRHRNLVRLVGYCHEQRDFLLVYEFIPHGDLKSHLYSKENVLAWRDRFKIALGLASALYYLHEQYSKCVWHRDVKSSNVMLDADLNAKLGDFGLALLLDHNVTSELTNPAGTLGYWAPEIFDGKARKESDVYSFGIVALEIACGRKPIVDDDEEPGSKMHLVEWVRRRYVKGLILEAADRRLNKLFEEKQMKSLLIVGLWCAQRDYRLRPSMRQVIGVLNGEAPLPSVDVPAYKMWKWIKMWPLSRR